MTRLSLITLALIASLSLTSFAQDCNNPLLAFFNLPSIGTPQSGANLPFCTSLLNSQTCCSNDTVATFQNRTNNLINNLNNYAAGRDLYIAQLRDRYLNQFDNVLNNITTNHQTDLQTITQANATLGALLQGIINNATQYSTASQNITSQFDAELDSYQKARVACFDDALQVQASAWCLACDPNYASEGVAGDNTVTFSDGLCQAISNTCAPYLNQSAGFNPLFLVRQAYWNLNGVANYLTNYNTNGTINPFVLTQDPYNPLLSQEPVAAPQAYVSDGTASSPGLCQALWANDTELASLLNIGAGEPGNAAGETNGFWAPDLSATGVNFDGLLADPGNYLGL